VPEAALNGRAGVELRQGVRSLTLLFLDIVTTAGILFVVAVGLLVVFGVLKIINFAHGGFLTLGGYAALVVTRR